MAWRLVQRDEWDHAACENPKCPHHPSNGGLGTKGIAKYQDGETTRCQTCREAGD